MTRGSGREAGINGAVIRPRPAFNPGFKLPWIDPSRLDGRPVPEREWLVEGLIPARAVTMINGDGGIGKSLLAMQLMTCCALDRPWLGKETAHVKAMGVFCEDEEDELHHRQDAINRHYGCTFADLGDCRWLSRVGNENTLVEFLTRYTDGEKRDDFEETYLVAHITNAAKEFGAQLLVLDSLHDLFSGNENDRRQARQFIQILREIAIAISGAVVLLAHPSMSGIQSGTGAAGSTAWNNAVRSRLYLTKPSLTAEQPEDRDARALRKMKANYSSIGDEILVRYKEGAFAVDQFDEPATGMVAHIEARSLEQRIQDALQKLASQMKAVSHKSRAQNYAPRVIMRMNGFGGIDYRKIEKAFLGMWSNDVLVERDLGHNEARNRVITIVPKEANSDQLL
jgi:RecA-family ATPase